uniref:transglycosylase domain-containing protein n=1 Tax=uncultured Thiodictyon sp. TaxID=1846217 RepID=UPI0025F89340
MFLKTLVWGAAALLASGAYLVTEEMKTSELQARYFSAIAQRMRFQMEPGPSPAIRYPTDGPYDQRLGYAQLPAFLPRLQGEGFTIGAQARLSPTLLRAMDWGFNAPYPEKTRAGLRLYDRDGKALFEVAYPDRVYPDFQSIPPLVLDTLLFIENRELLEERYPHINPVVEWDRFARASAALAARKLGANLHVSGGSTLATQLEKFRHSPGGRTRSAPDKVRQMGSASLRTYLGGPQTLEVRRAIALNYLNAIPLAAVPEYGEVHGLGDGLWAWFGADFDTVNALLSAGSLAADQGATGVTEPQARAYRQVLCLLLSQRRPAAYLRDGRADLQTLADSHLRLLATRGIISGALRDAALRVRTPPGAHPVPVLAASADDGKTKNVWRTRLASALGLERLYDLDRLDLTARATLDLPTQRAVTDALHQLRQPEQARAAGVIGGRLLNPASSLEPIVYSLMLFERGPAGNRLRVQADNYAGPLDVNEGIRLDLGSTAKLRTLVHYLEIIAQLHGQYAGQPAQRLRTLKINRRDHLSDWVIKQLIANPKIDLSALLQGALERRYSASPGEAFFTGGGLHTFANFNSSDNGSIMTVRQALQNSVNLVFIRLMRELVHYHLYNPQGVAHWIEEDDGEMRQAYLERFVDKEGQTYLYRFYKKYRGKRGAQALALLTEGVYPLPHRLATLYRSVYPQRDVAAFAAWMRAQHPALSAQDIDELYQKYSVEHFDLQDRGYLARIHPLELWLVGYLAEHSSANFSEVVAASVEQRQQVYRWLMKDGRRQAQDTRIATLLETDAFMKIYDAWKRVGYPFETMTPSYASAIGASGDRPAALAELVGILLNDGKRRSLVRYETLDFAAGTPYETRLQMPKREGEQVLLPQVAAAARGALAGVVEQGTAVRVKGAYKGPDGKPLLVGGKTGTGD